MIKEVNLYLNGLEKWKVELTALRNIIVECGLHEDFKWMHPSYSDRGKNIVLIHEFNEYCAILFQKGALLQDANAILVQQTENTQSARQIRFTTLEQITALKDTIKEYIFEAVEIERSGKKVAMKKTVDYAIPEELTQKFTENADFEKAFNALTPGRQKGYLLHFATPKQSKTKTSRIEENMERILKGYGLNDCVCGLSKRMPNCDGSHKQLGR